MASTHFHHQTDSRDSESSGQNTTGATYAGDSDVLPSEPNRDSEGLERNDFSRVAHIFRRSRNKEEEHPPGPTPPSFYDAYRRPAKYPDSSEQGLPSEASRMPEIHRHYSKASPTSYHPADFTHHSSTYSHQYYPPYPRHNSYGSPVGTPHFDVRPQRHPIRGGDSPYFQPPPTSYYHDEHHSHWPPVEHIVDIKPNDVLSGRGGATNSHSGNRAFRSLVKMYQERYLKAKKRDKPSVAAIVVERIREKGGRFLKRVSTTPDGKVIWMDIGDTRAKEKACQALREGAPEIRRKRKVSASTDDEDQKTKSDISPSQSLGQSLSEETTVNPVVSIHNQSLTNTWTSSSDHHSPLPLVIRPSPLLLQHKESNEIMVDQLSPDERDMYLRDFLPPDPAIRRRKDEAATLYTSHTLAGGYHDDEHATMGAWRVAHV